MLSLPMLFRSFGSGDELWNYNFAICILEGRLPYSDFSIIQTPLSACFSAMFLLMFGDSLISFRIAGVVLITLSFFVFYLICKTISNSQLVSCVASAFSFSLIYPVYIYNYNYLILFCVLIIIYSIINLAAKKTILVMSLIYGCLPLIKQSTGILLLLLFWAFQIWDVVNKKKKISKAFFETLSSLIAIIGFLLYLIITNSFCDFWQYAVLGISTFTHRTYIWDYVFSSLAAFLVVLFIIITIVMSVYIICKKKFGDTRHTHARVLMVTLVAGFVGYPLTDHFHMVTALIPYVVCLLFCFKYKDYSINQQRVCVFIVAIVVLASLLSPMVAIENLKFSTLNKYKGIPIDVQVETNIKLIDEFILDKKEEGKVVLIADECAAACMIPLNRYNKNFDMLLVGNVGKNSVQDLLAESENVVYLVAKDETKLSKQAHIEVIRYIKENYLLVGEVLGLSAYEKKV